MMEALSQQPNAANDDCVLFTLEDKQVVRQTLEALCCFLGLTRTTSHNACYVRMQVMFGKPSSLRGLTQHPDKIGKLIFALCKEFGSQKDSMSFRLVLRKIAYETHQYFKQHLDLIIPLEK